MSKNIVIQEGGIGKQLTVDKLKTDLVGGGSCLWIPEDERRLTTKYISENGTYKASDDGYYGYSEVTVSGIGSVTGKDPDGSGDDATATVDPETGDIVITKLPSSIEVITPPTNPYGIYTDGQTITKDGMVVKAYYESGGEWGIVPIGEITINPNRAVYDPSKDEHGKGTATGPEGMIPGDVPINFISGSRFTLPVSGYYSQMVYEFDQTINMCHPLNTQPIVAGTNMPISFDYYGIRPGGQKGQVITYTMTGSYTHDEKTAVWGQNNILVDLLPTQSDLNLSGADVPKAAWVMLYGTIDQKPAGSPQTITVTWPRPGDGNVLETTFEILVAPGYTPGDGE